MYKQYHQQYLLNCDYSKINLSDYTTGEKQFDTAVPLSYLDAKLETEADFNSYAQSLCSKSILLIDDRNKSANPICGEYSTATLKAYIFRFCQNGIRCAVYNSAA